ncbi:DUF3231 family protein [Halalkalibacter urbisdiaboli]|uniref:DUF3231 family protein n=1 Tax=Halalkalibacter urbisdiaboli TaxID=1960589 RepID=UPI000B4459A5|nr:DUF3231 family protein [Halalkalibacter urbisdiaboli]
MHFLFSFYVKHMTKGGLTNYAITLAYDIFNKHPLSNGISNYGAAMSVSPRRDLAATYVRLTAEAGHYAEDGLNMMIDYAWFERPPHAADRRELIKNSIKV